MTITHRERIEEMNPEAIFPAGLDEAIVGFVENGHAIVPIYDIEKSIEIIQRDGEGSEEEAREHMYFNLVNAHLGINTPVYANIFKQ